MPTPYSVNYMLLFLIDFFQFPNCPKQESKRVINGQYYRAYHGEITLSPKQQSDILQIVAQFGSLDGIKFDHYKTDWDFE